MEFSNNKIKKQPTVFTSYSWQTQVSPVVDHNDVKRLIERLVSELDDKLSATVGRVSSEFDRYQIFVCMNTWCFLFGDITGQSPLALKHYLISNGLRAAVKGASDFFDYLASNGDHGTYSIFWDGVLRKMFAKQHRSPATMITSDTATLLKFPKRLQLRDCIIIDESENWKTSNEICKNFRVDSWYSSLEDDNEILRRAGHPSARLMAELREVFELCVEGWSQDQSLFRLPPGSTAEKWPKCYLDKFFVAVCNQVWLREHGVNMPEISLSESMYSPTSGVNSFLESPYSFSRFTTVPKNLFKGRGVCPEPVSKQILGYQVSSGLYQCVRTLAQRILGGHPLDTKDQSWNQQLISDDNYATLDLTAASDSIAYKLGQELCARRPDLWKKIRACRSRIVEFDDGSLEINHHLVTMGNAVTFNLETIIFASIVILGIMKYLAFKDDLTPEEFAAYVLIAIYGDDIVVHNDIAETVRDLLQIFGFQVNMEKSFIRRGDPEAFYRESCGVEYRGNQVVTGCYFPRSLGDLPSAELVSLQHRLVRYESANLFLTQCVLDVLPTTIMSEEGCEYDDLWAPYPVEPDLAGSSDYGKFYTNYTLHYIVQQHKDTGYSVKSIVEETRSFTFALAHSAQKLSNKEFKIIQGAVMCHQENSRNLHDFRSVRCLKRETWMKSYRLESVDDYEYHMIIGSRQNRKLPSSVDELALLEWCMYLLTIGNGLEHMATDQFLDPKHEIRDRRDLLYDREIVWQRKRTLR